MSRHKLDPAFGNWFAGFTDGEGCFQIVQRQPDVSRWTCTFAIGLRADDRLLLETIHDRLGMGCLVDSPRRDATNPSCKLEVYKKADCQCLMDIFSDFPLQSKKQRDYELWGVAVTMWGQQYWSRHTSVREMENYGIIMKQLQHELREGRAYREPS